MSGINSSFFVEYGNISTLFAFGCSYLLISDPFRRGFNKLFSSINSFLKCLDSTLVVCSCSSIKGVIYFIYNIILRIKNIIWKIYNYFL